MPWEAEVDREVLHLALPFRSQLQNTALLLKWRKKPTELPQDIILRVNDEHFSL